MTSSRIEHLAEGVTLYCGDCIDVLGMLPANSVDACVTDPPYEINFMGKSWDGTGVAFQVKTWRQVLRVLKPGAHLLSFGGTRTYHRMACAIEDAGFEIRDCIQWIYGSGFPKSLDVSKAIDKAVGAERVATGIDPRRPNPRAMNPNGAGERDNDAATRYDAPASELGLQWSGYGTALKPACEPIVLARKPLSESNCAANVLKWGTGALNIDGCRIASNGDVKPRGSSKLDTDMHEGWARPWMEDRGEVQKRHDDAIDRANTLGRWPANIIHDGSDEVVGVFPADLKSGDLTGQPRTENNIYGSAGATLGAPRYHKGDAGSAARYFYTAKADSDDRLGSKHPTVKPLDIKQYLCRLVGRKGALILDPFAGTGTTGEACIREGFRAILIEREPEYQDDIRRRMKLAMSGPDERSREAMKAKTKDKPVDHGPLFGAMDL